MGISDIVTVASFVIGLFNGPSRDAHQCPAAPPPEITQSVVQEKPKPIGLWDTKPKDGRDYCAELGAEWWERTGQVFYDLYEGMRSEQDICYWVYDSNERDKKHREAKARQDAVRAKYSAIKDAAHELP